MINFFRKNLNSKNTFYIFLFGWFVVNLLQAIFTEMTNDEAYYSIYGQNLSWGYFDHPPMIALMTHLSSMLFSGNLGIRFLTIISQIVTLLLVWKLVDIRIQTVKKTILFFIVAASLVMFSAYGFITTPDVPLLFFTAFFLYVYNLFLKKENWSATLLLAISMAGLVYSKYQGVLVVGFVILSNLRLLTKYKFWFAGLLALVFLIPHFAWQYTNDFPSLKYHLVDRSTGFKILYILEYLPNQLAVLNPFTLGAVIFLLIKYKAENLFERAQYFIIIGFIGFFWLTAIRGHVEPQWTVACSVSMIILLLNKSDKDPKLEKYILRVIAPSLILILIVRILLTTSIPPQRLGFSGKEVQYKAVEEIAGDVPVVYNRSFQEPSLYTFFTGKKSFAISTLYSRQTQFDLWQFEQLYQQKPAFICMHADGISKLYERSGQKFEGFFTDSLQTTNRIIIRFQMQDTTVTAGNKISIKFSIFNPTKNSVNFNHPYFPVKICAVFLKGKRVYLQNVELSDSITILNPEETQIHYLNFEVPELSPEVYQFGLSLNSLFGPTQNSNFVKTIIK